MIYVIKHKSFNPIVGGGLIFKLRESSQQTHYQKIILNKTKTEQIRV
jgi:hypothetical protein